MKKYSLITIITTLLVATFSCTKDNDGNDLIDDNNKWTYIDSANSSFVKFYQVFAGNTPQIPTAPNATTGPQVFIYANGKKLNGTSLSYGGIFPASSVYAAIPAGTTKFEIINGRLDLSVVPNVPKFIAGDTLATFTANLDKGKNYSMFIGDTVPTVRVTVKEDNFTTPAVGTYKVRIANMFMNNVPTTDTVGLWSYRENRLIIPPTSHKEVSDWVQIPVPIINDTLAFIRKGATGFYFTGVSFSPTALRSYTFLGRGKASVAGKPNAIVFIVNN